MNMYISRFDTRGLRAVDLRCTPNPHTRNPELCLARRTVHSSSLVPTRKKQ